MNLIDKFSLQEHDGEYEDRPLKSLLYYCGEALGMKVPGYVIDKQFELANYFLLFISWDCPFEEGCEIVVLNKLNKIVGSYSFSPLYSSYNLHAVAEVAKDRYKLTFNESAHYEVLINYPKKHLLSRVVRVRAL